MPELFLTFDDGPNPIYTPLILGILRTYDIKATFFLCGKNVERYPEILSQIISEGHTIGNHTYSHSRLLTYVGALQDEIERTTKLIWEITSLKPNLFRPPWGIATPWLKKTIRNNGYQIVLWDIDPEDWRGISPAEIARRVIDRAKDRAIILLHDGDGIRQKASRENTLKALPTLIEALAEKGYTFQKIPYSFGTKSLIK